MLLQARLLSALVAAFLRQLLAASGLMLAIGPAAVAGTPSPAISIGHYVRSGNTGTLTIRKGEPGRLTFEIESIGGNCHLCSVSGTIFGKQGHADSWAADGSDSNCDIAFNRNSFGIEISAITPDECRAYCGARAGFEGIYKIAPENCSPKSQQVRRDRFLRQYRARDYRKASEELGTLIAQCSEFVDWIEIDKIRNDLALAQFHAGDPAACLKTLSETRAATSTNEDDLGLPPCEHDSYLDVAKATWHNKSLCAKAAVIR